MRFQGPLDTNPLTVFTCAQCTPAYAGRRKYLLRAAGDIMASPYIGGDARDAVMP
jgi:hypothetical protein